MNTTRRQWFGHTLAAGAIALVPGKGRASPEDMAIAMRNAYGNRTINTGRVNLTLPDIVRFELGPLSGSAEIETRIRVAAEQHITAVAEMSDGSLWSGNAHIIVTEAACLDALI